MSEDIAVGNPVTEAGPAGPAEGDDAFDEALLESLLVEEVSIDGMCGVY